MAIEVYSGKPGNGKSLGAVRAVIGELVNGERTVVTNLPLKLDNVCEWVAKHYPEKRIDVLGRIYLLEEEEVETFWRVRYPARVHPTDQYPEPVIGIPMERRRSGVVEVHGLTFPDFREANIPPHYYVIDEAQLALGARQWRERGPELLWMSSQHRHFGDEWLLITQHADNIDAQLRRLCQSRTHFTNWSYLNALPFVAAPRRITWTRFDGLEKTAAVMGTGTFTVDPDGYAGLYKTTGGAGGRLAGPIERRAKGVPFWAFVGAVPVGIAVLLWVLSTVSGTIFTTLVPKFLSNASGGFDEKLAADGARFATNAPAQPAVPAQPTPSAVPSRIAYAPEYRVASVPGPVPGRPSAVQPTAHLVGFWRIPKGAGYSDTRVWSDGRTETTPSGRFDPVPDLGTTQAGLGRVAPAPRVQAAPSVIHGMPGTGPIIIGRRGVVRRLDEETNLPPDEVVEPDELPEDDQSSDVLTPEHEKGETEVEPAPPAD